jgi:hypothetical protein
VSFPVHALQLAAPWYAFGHAELVPVKVQFRPVYPAWQKAQGPSIEGLSVLRERP